MYRRSQSRLAPLRRTFPPLGFQRLTDTFTKLSNTRATPHRRPPRPILHPVSVRRLPRPCTLHSAVTVRAGRQQRSDYQELGVFSHPRLGKKRKYSNASRQTWTRRMNRFRRVLFAGTNRPTSSSPRLCSSRSELQGYSDALRAGARLALFSSSSFAQVPV